ncbi:MAG: hypothetical protein MUC96_06155 [Myxococcaceae bacterium]|nr:hypothetical protein [Myxococcaceae bacterium]
MRAAWALALGWVALNGARAGAAVASYDVSAQALVTTRAPLPGDTSTTVTGDLEVDPAVQGGLAWATTLLTLRYAPHLIIREPQLAPRVLPLHQGTFQLQQRFERWSFTVLQEAAQGVADVGSLRLPQGAQPTRVFEVQTLGAVPFVRSASFFALDARPAERLTLAFNAGYLVSGDPTGGLQLPLQHGPVGQASGRFSLTRRLRLVTAAQASHATLVTGAEQSIAQLTESGELEVARGVVLTVGAGGAWTRERLVEMPGGPMPGVFTELLPVALASLSSAVELRGVPVQVDAAVQMAPFADRFTGFVYERVEGRLAVSSRIVEQLTASASAGLGYAIGVGRSPQAGDLALFGDAQAAWAFTRWFSLVGTGRLVWTTQPRLGGAQATLWAVTVGARFTDRDSASF